MTDRLAAEGVKDPLDLRNRLDSQVSSLKDQLHWTREGLRVPIRVHSCCCKSINKRCMAMAGESIWESHRVQVSVA